jgi:uracil-DNA glycosylase
MRLLSKPSKCFGCPLYGDGDGYVPDVLIEGSEVALMAQNPGPDEEAGRQLDNYYGRDRTYTPVPPQPLIGPTGYALKKDYLPRAGLSYDNMSRLNVLKCRATGAGGKKTNEMPKGDVLKQAVIHCTNAHLRIPSSTRLIVVHGSHALDFTQGEQLSIDAWRGYVAPMSVSLTTTAGLPVSLPVYVTQHTARLFRSPKMKPAARADFARLGKLRKGQWPAAWPVIYTAPTDTPLQTAIDMLEEVADREFLCSLDTEYHYSDDDIPGHHELTIVGVGWRHPMTGEYMGVQFDLRFMDPEQKVVVGLALTRLAALGRVVFQNMGADLPVLEHNLGIPRDSWKGAEDLMLMHSLLWCEQKHSLEYLASIRGVLPKYTHLLASDPLKKNQGDLVETLVCFESFEPDIKADSALYRIYKEQLIPLVTIHTRASEIGIPVNKTAVLPALNAEIDKMEYGMKLARAYCGWPFNMGSPGEKGHVATILYKWLGLPVQKDHKTKKATIDEDAIGKLRQKVGPAYDPEEEDRNGLSVDTVADRVARGANPVLEGRVLYAKALQSISHYLAPLVRL